MTDITLTNGRITARNRAVQTETAATLCRVDQLLREGRPAEALALLPAADTPAVRNARGVCLLRLGRPREAIEALRDLVFGAGGFAVRPDAEPEYQANYATALLLDGNTQGFRCIFDGIGNRSHPAVSRLDEAVRRWKGGDDVLATGRVGPRGRRAAVRHRLPTRAPVSGDGWGRTPHAPALAIDCGHPPGLFAPRRVAR